MNAMLVFVMAAQGIFAAFINGWYYKDPDDNLVSSAESPVHAEFTSHQIKLSSLSSSTVNCAGSCKLRKLSAT